jgi:tetratricopeptide (TPR) repeat protein
MRPKITFLRIFALLTALLIVSHSNAQIKSGEYTRPGKYSFIETYSPAPIQIEHAMLIEKLNKDIESLKSMSENADSWKGLRVLENSFETASGTLFYFEDIIDKEIELYKAKSECGVYLPVSRVRGKPDNQVSFYFYSFESARQFAEDIYHLQQHFINYSKMLAEFQILATASKERVEKPEMTEDQRKYIVQANALNNEKKYSEALDYFEKALKVNATSYPPAYYNMALIASLEGRYKYAIFNMKKYLILVPDAPDARAAQDKIYEWELK